MGRFSGEGKIIRPKNFGAKEFFESFKKHCDFLKVVIPPKRNKFGKGITLLVSEK